MSRTLGGPVLSGVGVTATSASLKAKIVLSELVQVA